MLVKRTPGRFGKAIALVVSAAVTGGAILATSATPANAEVFHVKLRNGANIDTAYQPQQAPFDANVVLILTESGNWIGINQKEVDSVQTESQIRGFGIALNFNTVAIGWAPNDAVDPAALPPNSQAATLQALQNIYQQNQEQNHYTVPQFVSTEQTSGIPSSFIGGGRVPQTPGGSGSAVPVPIPVPAPAAAPATTGGAPASQQ
jgi:hypothetical protein